MEMKSSISRGFKLGVGLIFVAAITLVGCGGGSSANNTPASTALTRAQIAAITPAQIALYTEAQIVSLGADINALSNSTLNALSDRQLFAITAAQIATLTPVQVRMIGAAAVGGVVGTSRISELNAGAWATLVSNPLQVAAITQAEMMTITEAEIVAIGVNFNSLSDSALNFLLGRQLFAITAAQIATLTPAQVRMIGAAAVGGVVGTSRISELNAGAWATLVSNPLQVAAITQAEMMTITAAEIVAMGGNFKSLATPALQALSALQLLAIDAAQITVLTPTQISILAGLIANTGISQLNTGAFSALSAVQIAVLTPMQKASLTAAQHTSCGC